MKEIPKKKVLSLEEIETRIHLYRDESRTISHRVDALSDRRKEINVKIKELKQMATYLKGK
jgi:DNA-binding transcriptional MerR regulator